jgi:hypothetical protein
MLLELISDTGAAPAPKESPMSVDMYGTTHLLPSIALPNGSVLANGAIPNEFAIECWIKPLVSRAGVTGGIFCTGSGGIDVMFEQGATGA